MNCQAVRTLLARAFDEGTSITGDVERHLDECAVCRRYSERLRALEGALCQVSCAPPCADLGARIRAKLASDESRRRRGAVVLGGVAGAVGLCLLEWMFSPVALVFGWLSECVAVCVPPHSPSRAGAFLVGQVDVAWAFCTRHLGAWMPEHHLGMAWALFGAVVLVLVVFDGIAVARQVSVGRAR